MRRGPVAGEGAGRLGQRRIYRVQLARHLDLLAVQPRRVLYRQFALRLQQVAAIVPQDLLLQRAVGDGRVYRVARRRRQPNRTGRAPRPARRPAARRRTTQDGSFAASSMAAGCRPPPSLPDGSREAVRPMMSGGVPGAAMGSLPHCLNAGVNSPKSGRGGRACRAANPTAGDGSIGATDVVMYRRRITKRRLLDFFRSVRLTPPSHATGFSRCECRILLAHSISNISVVAVPIRARSRYTCRRAE